MSCIAIQPLAFPSVPSESAARDTAVVAAMRKMSCKRLTAMRHTAQAQRLDDLMAAGAWTDAVLALIAIELPGWQLRRLAYDEGEWHCALSAQRSMPDWLDDTVESHHPDMAAALLAALQAALSREGAEHLTAVQRPAKQTADAQLMSCENYC